MDFSHLPEPSRRKLESRLALLPPQYRDTLAAKLAKLPAWQVEQALDRASPLIDRLLAAARKTGAALPAAGGSGDPENHDAARGGATTSGERAAQHVSARGHYNGTIQRGDAPMPTLGVMVAVIAGALVLAWRMGWLG